MSNQMDSATRELFTLLSGFLMSAAAATLACINHGPDAESGSPINPGDSNRDVLTWRLSDLYLLQQFMDGDFALIDATAQEIAFAKKLGELQHQDLG